MHRTPLASLAAATALAAVSAAQDGRLTFEQAAGRGEVPSFSARVAERWSWAPDGVHLVRGRGKEARWIDPRTWEETTPPEDAGSDDGEQRKAERERLREAFARIDGVDAKLARRIASARSQESADGKVSVRAHSGRLWSYREGAGARALTREDGPAFQLHDLSPDGKHVAFVQENDLVVVDTATGRRRAITSSGSEKVLNGVLDWVYQEELYGRGDFKAFWWSPDSRYIAYLHLDESDVHEFTVIDHVERGHFRVRPEITSYPKAGDPNPTVRLGIASVRDGATTWVDLSRYAESEPLVVRVGWTPSGDRALFMVQDRIQTWLDLNAADPESGAFETWIREESPTWVDRASPPRWLADGTFLWESDRTGFRHLYRYRYGGELVGAVTRGDWAVRGVEHVDEERGLLWFTATKDGAVSSNTYRIGLDGTGLVRLTRGAGWHSLDFDGDRSLFLDRWSSLASPGGLRLCDAEGEVLKELAQAEVPAASEYPIARWELVSIPARDGYALDGAVLRPVPFDPTRAHPVWLPTYSGPDAPSVRNRWNGSAWYQFLAQQGVVVLQVNVRSASGRGHAATSACYRRAGVQELADLEDAVGWLTAKPWADAERVGIAGTSYGGFMAAYALTQSDAFALGFASSGVYDWRMYDTIYTERYMDTPQNNPEGYDETSVIAAAKNLEGHLVLTHGTMDDNVHLQNAIQLAHALQLADKDFELMLYPEARHGIRDPAQRHHYRRLQWNAIREHLRPEAALAAAAVPASGGAR